MKHRIFFVLAAVAAITLCVQVGVIAQTSADGKIANVVGGGSSIKWEILVQNNGGTLTISFPDGRAFRKAFRAGVSPEISLSDKQLQSLPDGAYGYDLQLEPVLTSAQKETLLRMRGNDDDP